MNVRMGAFSWFLGLLLAESLSLRTAHAQSTPDQPSQSSPAPVPPATDTQPSGQNPSANAAPLPPSQGKPSEETLWWPKHTPQDSTPATNNSAPVERSLWWPQHTEQIVPAPPPEDASPLVPKHSKVPAYQRGLLFLPHVGINLPWSDNSGDYTNGISAGALFGVHLNSRFSLNGELNVEFMNPNGYGRPAEQIVDYTVSPLVHFGSSQRHIVIGMKLGGFSFTRTEYDADSYAEEFSASGLVWGFNVGGFIPIGPIAVGGLVSLIFRRFSNNCSSLSGATGFVCNNGDSIAPASDTLDVSLAMLL